MSKLTIIVDTREKRPLAFPLEVNVEEGTLGEGDYTARGVEHLARIERKSANDLWGTLHGGHDRFNRELARLGDIPRVALVVDDARSPDDVADRMGATPVDRDRLIKICRSIQWTGRIPIVWSGNRDAAARYVVDVLTCALEDYSMLPRCAEIARLAGPYTTAGELRRAALASLFGLCVVCARRPGPRPKSPAPGVCACGRKFL